MTAQPNTLPQGGLDESWRMLLHDVRNPLATAHVSVQVLRRQAAKARLQPMDLDQGLQYVEDAVTRIERLLDTFVQTRDVPSDGGIDLIELARQMAQQATAAADPVRVIEVLPEAKAVLGNWDRVDLERILSNLLENALKYSPAERAVLLTIGRAGDMAVLRIEDHGFGIPAQDLPHVFERGYRASNAAALAPGTGFGLATVENIVRHYGGTISIDSEPGAGTAVTVRLPLEQERHSAS